jgi:arsenate reductase
MDFVFTVCDSAAGETCPFWPGQPMTGIEDPAVVLGAAIQREAAFVTAFKYLRNRISVFVNLPIKSLDSMTLDRRLRDIGRMEGASPVSGKVP